MNILILSEAFPPETKSASTLFFELAESLVQRGHQVSVITRMPRYNVAAGTDLKSLPARENISGIDVYRFSTPPLARNIPIIRGFEHFLLGIIFFFGGLRINKFDVILVYSPPLPLGISGYWLGKIRKKPVLVNIQDLYPQTVIDLGLLKNRLLIKVSRMMESFIYRKSNFLTVHSDGNKEYVVNHGANRETTAVLHNWVDTDLIKPGNKANDFSQKYGLKDKFIVSFAGVMGFAQGLDVVISAANILRDKSDIQFVLVGDGIKKQELEHQAKSLGLKNVLFVDTQPRSVYPQILHASDICLVTLRKDLATPVVPGKLLSIMAAGRPVITSLPLEGDTPKIIKDFNCGICVEPDNPQDLAKAIIKLYNDRSLCEEMGKNGRKGAEQAFSRNVSVSKYEEIMNSLTGRSQHGS
ncbi:MAG: glycosyltransferase family 4 protein [Candidatus Margulisbacteria bacterium]|nr:glycosyltransferase family 4 protein [Candidatus Margulisiibacteriota bacterium]